MPGSPATYLVVRQLTNRLSSARQLTSTKGAVQALGNAHLGQPHGAEDQQRRQARYEFQRSGSGDMPATPVCNKPQTQTAGFRIEATADAAAPVFVKHLDGRATGRSRYSKTRS